MENVSNACSHSHRVPELTKASGCPFSLFGVFCPIPAPCFLGTHQGLATLRRFPTIVCIFYSSFTPLRLQALSSHLMTAIETAFASGSFLNLLPSSCSIMPSGQLSLTVPAGPMQPSFPYDGPGPWRQSATLSSTLKVLMGSALFSAVPSFTSITARILPLLTESSPLDGWSTLETVVTRLGQFASNIENDWAQSTLARIENEDDIGMSLPNSMLPLMINPRTLQHPTHARSLQISGQFLKRSSSRRLCSYSRFSPPSLTLTPWLPL